MARDRFVWHELTTTDTKSSAAFYAKVVAWNTQTWDQNPSYVMFATGARPIARLMALPDELKKMGASPHWLTYIGTPKVDETALQAATRGGKVLRQPEDIPAVGRFAVIQDPQGAVFAAFTPLQDAAPAGPPVVGDFSWHELATTDWRAALSLYESLFGWETTTAMNMGPEMGTYQCSDGRRRPSAGCSTSPKQQSGPPARVPYIKFLDSKKAAARIKKLATLVHGPTPVPGGDWIAQGIDPQGASFAVHSAKPVAARKPPKGKTAKRRAVKARVAKRRTTKSRRPVAARKGSRSRKKAGSRRRR
jgi:uncharacterized protein